VAGNQRASVAEAFLFGSGHLGRAGW
jgi:hypothetical protein